MSWELLKKFLRIADSALNFIGSIELSTFVMMARRQTIKT